LDFEEIQTPRKPQFSLVLDFGFLDIDFGVPQQDLLAEMYFQPV